MKRLLFASLCGAGLVILTACGTSAHPIASNKLPVILVHGAWSDASVWNRVAAQLRSQGHVVTAVNLPGHGQDATPSSQLSLAGYSDAVAKAMPVNGQALLVGHSMAGMVISEVAEKMPDRVAKLVYLAAYLPRDGESLYKLSQQDKGSHVGKFWRQDDPKNYSPATIATEGLIATFCADCSPTDQQTLVATHKAEAVPPLGTPVKLSAERFGRVPRAYIHTSEDRVVSLGFQQSMLAAAGGAAPVITLKASHMPMLTHPQQVAAAIVSSAP